jgi:hypothetical protein
VRGKRCTPENVVVASGDYEAGIARLSVEK